jgi:hypothetical protein
MYRKQAISALIVLVVAMGSPLIVLANVDEKQAHRVIVEFFKAFNAEDHERLQYVMQYPHVLLGQGANVFVADEQFVTDFDALRNREDWKFITLNNTKSIFTRPDKVHMLINFTRHNSKGDTYREVDGLWIVTKKNGRWGVSVRSY